MRSVQVRHHGEEYVIARRHALSVGRALGPHRARWVVLEALRSTIQRRKIARLLAGPGGAPLDQLEQRITGWLRDGVLRVEQVEARRQRRAPISGGESEGVETGDEPTVADDTTRDWIEIALVDDQGEPVPHELFELTLADGTVRRGNLDERGLRRVDGIPSGTCEVTFPKLYESEWSPCTGVAA